MNVLWPVTVLGGVLGGLAGGLPGGIFGAVLGHALDRYWGLKRWADVPARLRRLVTFEQVLFLCLGRLAKASGRVRQEHLQLARDLMQQYRLDESQRLQAMQWFNQGKAPDVRIRPLVKLLGRDDPARAVELIDSCWRMALATGALSSEQQQHLNDWAALAGLGKGEQQRMHQRHQRRSSGSGQQAPMANRDRLSEAAELLGVALDAEVAQIKQAYRRQLSLHHPDKLMARGASTQEQAGAGERIRAIQEAYERIKRYRGFR
ncbi:hypothetical protein BVH74_06940 [Halopseudomonas phragmitis]|uniref:J domain-containing protein n=2 Tax=Pseudomonadaceae TaxID=135621 RepID=A0A1V0B3I8_9GAMM|nr:hypothetical protein BVH74_06940 [Halopseudomonas phragmitis]RHW22290.1 hypothetical protein C2846_04515 [Pseudomonas jilinensis]